MSGNSARARLLDLIAVHVRRLVKRDTRAAHRHLSETLDLTGFIHNRSSSTCEQLGVAILAIAPVAEGEDLINTAHAAVFGWHRLHYGYERADKLADEALSAAGIDADRWTKALEGDGDDYSMMERIGRTVARKEARAA